MECFDIFFSLKLGYKIFSAAEQFFINLQAKDTTVGEGLKGASRPSSHYSAQFDSFYASVISFSQGLTEEPVLPRYRRRPRRIDDGCSPHVFVTPKDLYRHIYFEVLENYHGEIERRFDHSDLLLASSLEKLLLNAANGSSSVEIPSFLSQFLSQEEVTQLEDQLHAAICSGLSVREVTNIRTICEALSQSDMVKQMLGMVNKLAKIYLTNPVTSVIAESIKHKLHISS